MKLLEEVNTSSLSVPFSHAIAWLGEAFLVSVISLILNQALVGVIEPSALVFFVVGVSSTVFIVYRLFRHIDKVVIKRVSQINTN